MGPIGSGRWDQERHTHRASGLAWDRRGHTLPLATGPTAKTTDIYTHHRPKQTGQAAKEAPGARGLHTPVTAQPPASGDHQSLIENYVMRGWKWFESAIADEAERAMTIERPSEGNVRAERVLWLGVRLAAVGIEKGAAKPMPDPAPIRSVRAWPAVERGCAMMAPLDCS